MKIVVALLAFSLASCQSYGPSLTQIARGPAIQEFSFNDMEIFVLADNAEREILKRMNAAELLQYGAALAGIGLAAGSAFASHGATVAVLALSGTTLPLVAGTFNNASRSAMYATALLNINNMIAHYLDLEGNPSSTRLTTAGINLYRNVNLAIAMLRTGSVSLLPVVTSTN